MYIKKLFFSLVAAALVGQGCPTAAPTVNQPESKTMAAVIERSVNENGLKGMYFVPSQRGEKLPGLLVVHEWWGLNEQIKDEARNLADKGYGVFAISLYGDEVATESKRAGELATVVRGNPADAERQMKLALDFLEKQSEVEGARLGVVGWCFGGAMGNILASSGDKRVKAEVVYYGTPITDADRLKKMSMPILGHWGAEDQGIKADAVRAFEKSLKDQGTSVEFHIYDGAGHAFANPTRSDSYRPEATATAWTRTLDFLAKNLK